MSRFHRGDAEIMDLKPHLGFQEQDERSEDASTRLRGRPRIGAALQDPGFLPFVFSCNVYLQQFATKSLEKKAGEILDG